MKTPRKKKFDPYRQFDSPTEAIEYCEQQKDPMKAMWAIAKANVEAGEYGFASEVVYESEVME